MNSFWRSPVTSIWHDLAIMAALMLRDNLVRGTRTPIKCVLESLSHAQDPVRGTKPPIVYVFGSLSRAQGGVVFEHQCGHDCQIVQNLCYVRLRSCKQTHTSLQAEVTYVPRTRHHRCFFRTPLCAGQELREQIATNTSQLMDQL